MPPFSSPLTRARSARHLRTPRGRRALRAVRSGRPHRAPRPHRALHSRSDRAERSLRSPTLERARARRRARAVRRLVLAAMAMVTLLGGASLSAGKWREPAPSGPDALAVGHAPAEPHPGAPGTEAAPAAVGGEAARSYLDRAVTADGRVTRDRRDRAGAGGPAGGWGQTRADRAAPTGDGGHDRAGEQARGDQAAGDDRAGGRGGRGGGDRTRAGTGAGSRAGGDVWSEDQATALLLAAAAGDRELFDRVWDWTRTHLRRPDGLLARRWSARDGDVVDDEADAGVDLDTAHALVLAGRRFHELGYLRDAMRLGGALLAHETVQAPDGRPVLVAGPWATRLPEPVLNPGDISPVAYERLARATGDPRWRQLAETGLAHLRQLTHDGRLLPPDWALLRRDGTVRADQGPGRDTIRYGDEASRVLLHLAGSCGGETSELAAALWRPVSQTVVERAGAHHLDGQPQRRGANPHLLLAGAAAAQAAGHLERRDELLAEVDLDAWGTLGRLWLEGPALGGCPGKSIGWTSSGPPAARGATSRKPPLGPISATGFHITRRLPLSPV